MSIIDKWDTQREYAVRLSTLQSLASELAQQSSISQEEELKLLPRSDASVVAEILRLPAGYDVGLAGIATVRRYEKPTWVVEIDEIPIREFETPERAAKAFVAYCEFLELGLESEK